MKKLTRLIATGITFILLTAACQAAAEPEAIVEKIVVTQEVEGETITIVMDGAEEMAGAPSLDQDISYSNAQTGRSRMIIKDAVMTLLVADTDIAIDRLTQVIGDMDGYTISSRIWYQTHFDESIKYATFSIGVPVENFEATLQRLRNLSVQVLDETASGEDVTDQFVDLQSRLENLRATRDRIREFLDTAETVEEALQVNEQLTEVEGQIEEIQGRINYLSDRAAFSTITVTLEPELPDKPTPTPSPTPTATPTPTPVPWTASETYQNATRTVGNAYKGITNGIIWFVIVIIPIIAPPAIILWLIARTIIKRTRRSENTEKE